MYDWPFTGVALQANNEKKTVKIYLFLLMEGSPQWAHMVAQNGYYNYYYN